jgi:glutamate synthase domain-containing protein 2
VVIGTPELVALGCVRCSCCESGRGCPRGIATTDPELMMQMSLEWATQRLVNLLNAWREQMVAVLSRLGMKSARELRGRSDVLCYVVDEPAQAVEAAQ